jgi:DNA-binding FrmR family transcriptional regulator
MATGCSNNKEFVKKIDDFQTSVNLTTTAIGTYYLELNSFERELYLQERLLDPSKEVLTTERNPKDPSKIIPTALAGRVFSAESIKARTDAIRLLGAYGRNLAELAGTDAPARVAAASKVLGENLGRLGTTFDNLTGDQTAKKFVAPAGALSAAFGVIGQLVLEEKRDAALTKAIQEAAPQVRIIIDLLEEDLETVIVLQQLTGTKAALTELITYYNKNRQNLNLEERRKALDEIYRAQERYDIAVAFNPSGLMSSLRDAHEALVKYATSDRTPQNLASLVSSLEVFKERAETVAAAVSQLHDLKKGTL